MAHWTWDIVEKKCMVIPLCKFAVRILTIDNNFFMLFMRKICVKFKVMSVSMKMKFNTCHQNGLGTTHFTLEETVKNSLYYLVYFTYNLIYFADIVISFNETFQWISFFDEFISYLINWILFKFMKFNYRACPTISCSC